MCHQFVRLQRPPFRLRLSPFRHLCKRLVLLLALRFRQNFNFCDSGHPNSDFSYRATVVSCRGQRPFSFSRLSRHYAQGSSFSSRSARLGACGFYQPCSSSVPTRFFIRYIVVSCLPIFRSCIFFGFLVFHRPLQKRERTGKEYCCFPFVWKTKTFKWNINYILESYHEWKYSEEVNGKMVALQISPRIESCRVDRPKTYKGLYGILLTFARFPFGQFSTENS